MQAEELWTIYGQAVVEALDAAKMTSYDAKRLRAIKPVMPSDALERAQQWAKQYAPRIKARSAVVRDFVAKYVPGHKLVHD